MKKEPVVCILDEDVSIREPPLHLIRSHGFDVDSFLEMKHTSASERGRPAPQAHTQWAGFTGHAQYSKAACRGRSNVSARVLTVLSEGLRDLLVR